MNNYSMQGTRALLAASSAGKTAAPSKYFHVYRVPIGQTALLRFMPPLIEGALPWREKFTHDIPFAGGIINSPDDEENTEEPVHVKFLSMQTWGQPDFITKMSKPWWKGNLEEQAKARTYWRKSSHLIGVFVRNAGFQEKDPPADIRRIVDLTKSIFDRVLEAVNDPDIEDAPWSDTTGRDFKVSVGTQGEFRNYGRSAFAVKPSPLTEQERKVLREQGPLDLEAEIGPPHDAVAQEMIREMFAVSTSGGAFDCARWGARFRAYPPFGSNANKFAPASTQTSGTPPANTVTVPPGEGAQAVLNEIGSRIRNNAV